MDFKLKNLGREILDLLSAEVKPYIFFLRAENQ